MPDNYVINPWSFPPCLPTVGVPLHLARELGVRPLPPLPTVTYALTGMATAIGFFRSPFPVPHSPFPMTENL